MVRARHWLMALAAVMVLLAACRSAGPQASAETSPNLSVPPSLPPSAASIAPSASAPAAREPLAQVLDFLTLDTRTVLFTDWGGLKAAYGKAELTSADPLEARLAFLLATSSASASDAPYACFACRGYRADALKTHWGFDNLDLAWEAEIQQQRAGVYVLRFMDGVDLGPLIGRFDERGYSTAVRDGATIRLHAQDRSDWWIQLTPAILNAAFLPDGHTLVLATSQAALESALSQDGQLVAMRAAPVLREALTALERPTSAFFALDLNELCNPFLRMTSSEELRASVQDLLDRAGTLHPYTLMAVGNRGSLSPAGRIVFGYGDPAVAAADLAGRRLLADEGVAVFARGHQLRETYFTLVDARVSGGMLILSVGPPVPASPLPSGDASLGTANFLLRINVDAIFAACDLGV